MDRRAFLQLIGGLAAGTALNPRRGGPMAKLTYGGPAAHQGLRAVQAAPHQAVHLHMYQQYFNDDHSITAQMKAHIDAIAALNADEPNTVTRVRVDVGWSTFYPNADSYTDPPDSYYYLTRLRNVLGYLATEGLKAYLCLHQSPKYTRPSQIPPADPAPGQTKLYNNSKQLPDLSRSNLFGQFMTWLVPRVGTWVDEYEIWNEPNLAGFSGAGRNTPTYYMPLLVAGYAAAKAAMPKVKIIGANVSQCDLAWIRECYEDFDLRRYCDKLGVHPYQGRQSVPPEATDLVPGETPDRQKRFRIALGVPAIRDVMLAHDHDVGMWFTEQGWGADDVGQGGPSGGVSIGYPIRDVTSAGPLHPEIADSPIPLRYADLRTKAADFVGRMLKLTVEHFPYVELHTVYEVFDPAMPHPINAQTTNAQKHQLGFEIFGPAIPVQRFPQAQQLVDFRRAHRELRAISA